MTEPNSIALSFHSTFPFRFCNPQVKMPLSLIRLVARYITFRPQQQHPKSSAPHAQWDKSLFRQQNEFRRRWSSSSATAQQQFTELKPKKWKAAPPHRATFPNGIVLRCFDKLSEINILPASRSTLLIDEVQSSQWRRRWGYIGYAMRYACSPVAKCPISFRS